MTTVPEFLRWDLAVGEPASLMLRSGQLISGILDEVDLTAYVVRIGGWTVRVDEVAGARSGHVEPNHDEANDEEALPDDPPHGLEGPYLGRLSEDPGAPRPQPAGVV